jgi:hypothetical protein
VVLKKLRPKILFGAAALLSVLLVFTFGKIATADSGASFGF